MATLSWFLNVSKVALGLGFVIFLHELGHFLLAKWNGVKVEKFSIGFGPTILGFKKGETDYVIAAVPLGGFVKMLGEGPDEEANKSSDPRAYPNKSVGARMAIISAGVIMNLILGLACFAYAYGQGMDEVPTKVGAVMAGAPAYVAGMRSGDEIVSMDGRRNLTFNNLTLKIRLSGQGQVIHFELKRPGQEALVPVDIEPRRDASADVPSIGVYPSFGLTLADPPFRTPPGLAAALKDKDASLKPKDKVVAVGPLGTDPTPIGDFQDYDRIAARYRDKPLNVVAQRATKVEEGAPAKVEKVTVELPPNRFVDFGFRLKIEPIVAIRSGSPAEKAGFLKGDTILRVDGRDDFDPMRLPSNCYEKTGQPMTFEVERPEPGSTPQVLTLRVTPDDTPPWTEIAFPEEPLNVPGLGLAYPVRTKIEAITPGSPADKAGLKVGDVLNGMSFSSVKVKPWRWPLNLILPEPKLEEVFNDSALGWPSAFQYIQSRPLEPMSFRVNNADARVTIAPEPVATWYHPLRGERFQIFTRRTPPMTVQEAVMRGVEDTVDNVLSIYAMFRSLAQSRVSPKNLGGPILIAQVAYEQAGMGLTELIRFLGFLSINLAVLNFLPIPPLDGGQMVFLCAEKVRGKPLPESALIAGTYVGLFLVLGLMVFVIFQDVSRLVTG